ncbi:MAG: hypothetical protein P1V20_17710 [Verrucomicrobiales bacterium]|nr:hypothetical protein [Verrucomicrobiales bacterium]
MASNRRTAPAEVRLQIISCLQGEMFRIYPDGQRFIDNEGFTANGIIEDLIEEIEQFEIFVLPPQSPNGKTKYDYVIRYFEPDLLVYVKMFPTDSDPPMVWLTFHKHNIPGGPLPLIPIEEPDEN